MPLRSAERSWHWTWRDRGRAVPAFHVSKQVAHGACMHHAWSTTRGVCSTVEGLGR